MTRPRAHRVQRAAIARIGVLLVRLAFAVGRLRPLSPRVVLGIGQTSKVDGNLLAIQRELERRPARVEVTVVAYRTGHGVRGRIRSAWQALQAGYHLATARVFLVDDWFFPMYAIKPRPGTVRVQVWHAAGAFKRFGYSVLDRSFGADEDLVRLVPIHSNYDACLVSSSLAIEHYMDAFRLPRDRFTSALGLPRTDVFFDPDRRARATASIRRRYALPTDRHVLLYAPTFRGDTVESAHYEDDLDLSAMHEALAADWVLLLRLHPFVRRSVAVSPDLLGFAIDVSDWPDVNELMFVADMLVTDYSSAVFEFALLGRPMAFFAPDIGAYERERGFYLAYWTDLPGPVFETTSELAEFVRSGRFDADAPRAFARRWFDLADGHASARFVDRIVLPALRGDPVRLETEPAPEDRVIAPAAPPPVETGTPGIDPAARQDGLDVTGGGRPPRRAPGSTGRPG